MGSNLPARGSNADAWVCAGCGKEITDDQIEREGMKYDKGDQYRVFHNDHRCLPLSWQGRKRKGR